MDEEKFSCWAIDFWEKNKELDSLHLLNKFIEEEYFPLNNKLKEVRELVENNYIGELPKKILEILDKEVN